MNEKNCTYAAYEIVESKRTELHFNYALYGIKESPRLTELVSNVIPRVFSALLKKSLKNFFHGIELNIRCSQKKSFKVAQHVYPKNLIGKKGYLIS